MTRVVVDTSVLAAVAFGEPEGDAWSDRLDGATVFAPPLLRYELQSVARRKCRQQPRRSAEIVAALALALDPRRGITWMDADPAEVVLVASETGLTTYDASYLCLAATLGADLLTADQRLASAVDPFAN
jgi:predicted nucleic acid-binding protein